MAEQRKKALVVCPGRGSYNREELGYLARHHGDQAALVGAMDAYRASLGQTSLSDLDGRARFSPGEHGRGDNASLLIHACAACDFLAIDQDRYDVVAVTGNSMGWYTALGCGGALSPQGAMILVNTMGRLMQEASIGGQVIYPMVDEKWRTIPGRRQAVMGLLAEIQGWPDCRLEISIELGGMLLFGGNEKALKALTEALPPVEDRFPLRLAKHAAFHTSLQQPVAARARAMLAQDLFARPALPLIDGRGVIWSPYASDPTALWDYTLGHQVVKPYDFTRAIQVGLREFAPDSVILLGPGNSLGGALAQSMIGIGWQGFASKADFQARQAVEPFLLSMGLADQRALVAAR